MSVGVKISVRGRDVDAGDAHQNVNTKFNSPKVDLFAEPAHFGRFKHEINTNVSAGTYTLKTVNHNYGYKPMVIVHYEHPESDNYNESTGMLPFPVVQAATVLYEWKVLADEEKVEFQFIKTSDDPTGEEVFMRYYIFAEPAS